MSVITKPVNGAQAPLIMPNGRPLHESDNWQYRLLRDTYVKVNLLQKRVEPTGDVYTLPMARGDSASELHGSDKVPPKPIALVPMVHSQAVTEALHALKAAAPERRGGHVGALIQAMSIGFHYDSRDLVLQVLGRARAQGLVPHPSIFVTPTED